MFRVLVEIPVTDVRNAPKFLTKYIQSIPKLRLVYISTVTLRSHTRSLKLNVSFHYYAGIRRLNSWPLS